MAARDGAADDLKLVDMTCQGGESKPINLKVEDKSDRRLVSYERSISSSTCIFKPYQRLIN